jgi:hypothetical protein
MVVDDGRVRSPGAVTRQNVGANVTDPKIVDEQ